MIVKFKRTLEENFEANADSIWVKSQTNNA